MASSTQAGLLASRASKYPRFADGDVLIVLCPGRQYQLYSNTLRLHSDFFRALLTEDNAAPLSGKAKREGVKIKYRVDLVLPEDVENQNVGALSLRALDDYGRPTDGFIAHPVPNARPPMRIYRHYDNIIRSYFYQPLRLSDSSLDALLFDVIGLTEVAESLGSIKCVSASMDIALVKQGQALFRSISANPAVWADLGVRIHSDIVVREAICHLVGQWNRLQHKYNDNNMNPDIRKLCQGKFEELEKTKQAIEIRIMAHYPQEMQEEARARGAPNVTGGSRTTRLRGAPTKSIMHSKRIMDWMALSLFRHWMGQAFGGDNTRRAPDGGYRFYTCISKGGDHYIDVQSVESFVQYFPLSAKARNQFDAALGRVKEGVRAYVAALVESKCSLDTAKYPVKWLTCTSTNQSELPWSTGVSNETEDAPIQPLLRHETPRIAAPVVPKTRLYAPNSDSSSRKRKQVGEGGGTPAKPSSSTKRAPAADTTENLPMRTKYPRLDNSSNTISKNRPRAKVTSSPFDMNHNDTITFGRNAKKSAGSRLAQEDNFYGDTSNADYEE